MLVSPRLSKTDNRVSCKILVGSENFLSYKLYIIVYKVLLNKPMEIPAVVSWCRLTIFSTPTHNPFKGLEELSKQLMS